MTISYSGNFCHLLFRWKGSIWKSCWLELTVFLALYYLLRLFYNGLLPALEDGAEFRQTFEYLAQMFDEYTKQIPLTFLLGFYIAAIVKRWWNQFEWVAWPDDLVSLLCLMIPGEDEDSLLRRHTAVRYLNLTAAMAWRDVSTKVRKRFPSIEHLVRHGLMTEQEHKLYSGIQTESVRWSVPLHWVQKIVQDEMNRQQGSVPLFTHFFNQMQKYRESFRRLYCYDWVCIPLVYTQVAALATYGYFAFCLIGRQFLDPSKHIKHYEVDFVVPIFTIVQFLFFVGWFKVGQDLMRPFGTDDDDIELNYIFDRNMQASFAIINSVDRQRPPVIKDKFWHFQDRAVPPLPHTKLSSKCRDHPPKLLSYVKLKTPEDGLECEVELPVKRGPFVRQETHKRFINW